MDPEQDAWSDELKSLASLIYERAEDETNELIASADESRADRMVWRESIALDIQGVWWESWRLYDAVVHGMEQDGVLMLKAGDVDDAHSPMREALILLHASATMTLHEIRVLLQAGLVTGAAARWRALHEVATTTIVIAHANVEVAQRYLDHGFVNQVRRMESFYAQPHPAAPPMSVRLENLAEAERRITAHTMSNESAPFANSYGWANPLMPLTRDGKHQRPTFDKLERLADQADVRLLMSAAHGHVHNDAAGIRTAVLPTPDSLLMGGRPDQIETVAVPVLRTVTAMVATSHLGFEPEINDTSRLLGQLAVGLMKTAQLGVESFQRADPTIQRLF